MNARSFTYLIKFRNVTYRFQKCCYQYCNVSQTAVQTRTWTFKVEPYWKLIAELDSCKLNVMSYDPVKNVDGNKLIVEAYCDQGNDSNSDVCNAKADESSKCVTLTSNFPSLREINVSTPPAFDLSVNLRGDASLSISNLESISVAAYIQDGDITLNNIKAQNVTLSAANGKIISTKILQGNLKLKASTIKADKIQSPEAELFAATGNISLKDVYTEKFSAVCESGDVTIQSLHGNSEVTTSSGNIAIGTLEGNASAITQHGDINIHLADTHQVHLSSDTGNIFISLRQDSEVAFDLSTASVVAHNLDVGKETIRDDKKDGPLVSATAKKGSIEFEFSSWMQRIQKFRKQFKAS